MKSQILIVLMLFTLLTACAGPMATRKGPSTSPGQMKKITGSKSAKPFAPGQMKKKK